jgi:hypothetical protein
MNEKRYAIVAPTHGEAVGIHRDLGSPDGFECWGISQAVCGRGYDHVYFFKPVPGRMPQQLVSQEIIHWKTRLFKDGSLHII